MRRSRPPERRPRDLRERASGIVSSAVRDDISGWGRSHENSPLREPHSGQRARAWCMTEMRWQREQLK